MRVIGIIYARILVHQPMTSELLTTEILVVTLTLIVAEYIYIYRTSFSESVNCAAAVGCFQETTAEPSVLCFIMTI